MRIAVLATAVCLSIVGLSAASDVEAAIRRPTSIPAQGLAPALQILARDRDFQVVYRSEVVGKLRTQGASGELTADEALRQLLSGTGLTFRYVDDKTVTITPAASPAPTATDAQETPSAPQAFNSPKTPDPGTAKKGWFEKFRLAQNEPSSQTDGSSFKQENPSQASDRNSESRVIDEVVVTGSHIRGVQPSSPVVTIAQEEMRLSGHNNLGEVIRSLPQNFSGGQNPGVTSGAATGAGLANQNITGASSLNLRGLGPDATLTLLNGTRLPYDGFVQATDVSVIPVAAIDRMEVLLDGASAIYGSDAVGGVANIVLKRDYKGVELSARYGAATDGGYGQEQYTALGGTTWGSGGFLITGELSKSDPVKPRQRDYLSYMLNQNVDIYRPTRQKGALFSGHQDLGRFAELHLDTFYTERASNGSLSQSSTRSFGSSDYYTAIWGAAPSLRFALPGEWSLRLHGFLGRDEAERLATNYSVATGLQTSQARAEYFNGTATAGGEADGPLFDLPGGRARLSVGGGYRRTTFDSRTFFPPETLVSGITGENRNRYAYGEINLPLISESQGVPLVARLSLNGALRYEDYESFGKSTVPKIGAIWGLTPGFDIRASWGRSFKAPTLLQQYQSPILSLFTGAQRGAVGAPADSQVLQLFGGSPALDPERAEIITAGFVAQPEFLPGFRLEFSWFDIDYTDRVAFPINVFTQALSNPVYAEFVNLNPTAAQQAAAFATAGLPVGTIGEFDNFAGAPYDPAKVVAIVNNGYTNVSNQRVKGVDLTARHTTDLLSGSFTVSVNGSWITDATRKLTSLAPEQQAAGIVFWPAKFKGRLGASWSREGFTLSSIVNHTGAVTNYLVTPNVKGDPMTTLDLVVDYQMDSDLLGDIGFNVAITNAFNERPPTMQPPLVPTTLFVNYDSTNYSALGCVVSATVTKRF